MKKPDPRCGVNKLPTGRRQESTQRRADRYLKS